MKNILLITFVILYSCRSEHNKNLKYSIDIKKGVLQEKVEIPFSQYFSDIEYIPLETNPKCFISYISYLHINDESIIIANKKKVLKFDRTGSFLFQIGAKGKGPEEYGKRINVQVNDKNNEVYIYSFPNKMLVFDKETGEFKRRFKINVNISKFIVTTKNIICVTEAQPLRIKNASVDEVIIMDLNGNIISTIKEESRKEYDGNIICPYYIYNNKGTVFFKPYFKDDFYKVDIERAKKIKYASFQTKNKKRIEQIQYDPIRDPNKNYLAVSRVLESDSYLFINARRGLFAADVINIPALYLKRTKKFIHLDNGFKCKNGLFFWPKFKNDDNFIQVYETLDLIEFSSKDKTTSSEFLEFTSDLDISDNPILAITKLK